VVQFSFLGENIQLEKELFVQGKKKSAASWINSLQVYFSLGSYCMIFLQRVCGSTSILAIIKSNQIANL